MLSVPAATNLIYHACSNNGVFIIENRRFYGYFDPDNDRNPLKEDQLTTSIFRSDHIDTSKFVINKQCYGVPFKIGDETALNAMLNYHKGESVEIVAVSRLLMPFWLCRMSIGGTFKAEYFKKDPNTIYHPCQYRWMRAPKFQYSYPLEDHLSLCQISASYLYPLSSVEETLAGNHIPSLLLSRYELLEKLEEMKRPPKLVRFEMSVDTAVAYMNRRVTRDLVKQFARKELHKHFGSFNKSLVFIDSMKSDLLSIRPVFLPLYVFKITTNSAVKVFARFRNGGEFTRDRDGVDGNSSGNSGGDIGGRIPFDCYVCGITGRATGPCLTFPVKQKALFATGAALPSMFIFSTAAALHSASAASAASASTAVAATSTTTTTTTAASSLLGLVLSVAAAVSIDPAALSLIVGSVSGLFTVYLYKTYLWSKLMKTIAERDLEVRTTPFFNSATDESGYKWVVESEEEAEYQYREDLRARARRRAEFKERLQEDAKRNDARRKSRMHDGTHKARHDLFNSDPLGYYALLGLEGDKAKVATLKDIQAAFRKAVQKHHPDLHSSINKENESGDGETRLDKGDSKGVDGIKRTPSQEEMQRVIKAYSILRDARKRKEYDSGGFIEKK